MTEHKQQLEKQLWAIANDLRGKMSADEFRDYILWFIFFKYLSENFIKKANERLKDFLNWKNYNEISNEEAETYKGLIQPNLGYFLLPNELFSEILKKWTWKKGKETNIIADLINIFSNIENSTTEESEWDFKGFLYYIYFNN